VQFQSALNLWYRHPLFQNSVSKSIKACIIGRACDGINAVAVPPFPSSHVVNKKHCINASPLLSADNLAVACCHNNLDIMPRVIMRSSCTYPLQLWRYVGVGWLSMHIPPLDDSATARQRRAVASHSSLSITWLTLVMVSYFAAIVTRWFNAHSRHLIRHLPPGAFPLPRTSTPWLRLR